MALNASQQWWNRVGGNNLNGGGFDPDAAEVVYTAVAQTLTLSARFGEGITATAGGGTPFASGDVGKMILDVTTGSSGLAQITAFTSSTIVTVRILRPFIGLVIVSSSWKLSTQINYADQDAPQLSLTDFASTASTTITSVTGGFTDAMIGNMLRLASGTGTPTPDYYRIVTRVDTNTITVDKVSGTYTLGVGRIGGAFATLEPLMSTGNGGLSTPPIASRLAPGHIINMQGLGSDDPTVVDYDYKGTTTAGYYTAPNGSVALGRIQIIGYNGRPLLQTSGLLLLSATHWTMSGIKLKIVTSATYVDYGNVTGAGTSWRNVIVDLNGNDAIAMICGASVIDCEVRNSGGAAGSLAAILTEGNAYGSVILGTTIRGVRGIGVKSVTIPITIINTVITGCGSHGIQSDSVSYGVVIDNCTINNCGGDGIRLTDGPPITIGGIRNNILSNNTGYGLNCTAGTTALNTSRAAGQIDYNNYYNNTAGARNNISAGANDTTLDPQYTNVAGLDFSVGANMKAIGFPGTFRGTTTAGYMDLGAAQRQEAGGSAGRYIYTRTQSRRRVS